MSINFTVKWATNTDELKRSLSDGLAQVEFTRAAVDKLTRSLSGENAVRSANNWALALNNLGGAGGTLAGVQKLTAAETDRATASIDRAIAKYKLLGEAAPSALMELAESLHKATAEHNALESAQLAAEKSTRLAAVAAQDAAKKFDLLAQGMTAAARVSFDSAKLVAGMTASGKAAEAEAAGLSSAAKAAAAAQKPIDDLAKSFGGQTAIKSANDLAAAIQKIGGVEKLTADEIKRANVELDVAVAKYKAIGQSAPAALTDVSAALKKAGAEHDALANAQKGLFQSSSALTGVFGQLTAALSVSSLISKAVGTLVDFTKQAFASADSLVNLSNKTGLSTETIQRMQFVAQQSGSDMQQFADAAFKMGVNISEGTKKARDGAEALGLDWQQLRASSPDSQFEMVVAALEKMEDPQKRNAAAVALFGKTAKDILPAIIDGYTKISKEATVAGDAQVHAVDAFGDAIDRWKARTVSGFTQTIGSFLLYREAMDGLTDDEKKFVVESDRSITSMEKAKAAIIAAYQAKKQFGNITGTSGTDPSLVGSDVKLLAEKPQALDKSFVGDLKAAEDGYRALTDAKKAEIQAALQLNTSNDDIINSMNLTDGVLVIAKKAFEEHKTAVTQAAAASKKYAEEWQRNDDDTQKIWGESFAAFKNFDKDSLASHLAVLDQQRENDINAATNRIAETTGSTEQLDARVFAINEKYRGLENEARLADDKKRLDDEQKAQDLALDLEMAMTKQIGELRHKQAEADAKDKAHWLAVTNDAVKQNLSDQIGFERDADDTRAGLYLSDGQNRLRALDLWMTDERAKLASRQVYSQQAEDALVQLYQSKAQAIILSNDPIFKAWQALNVDMRSDWASTWSQALDGSISFGQAFEDTLKKSIWDPFKNLLAGMLSDFESILLSPMLNALRQLETAFVNSLVNAGLGAAGVGGGGGGSSLTGSLLNQGVNYGARTGLAALVGGGGAAGGSGYVASDIAGTAHASLGGGGIGLGAVAGAAGAGIAGWELGQWLGGKTESKTAGAAMGAGAGAATGAAIGSVVPGLGTAVGALVGGIAGAIAGWRAAGKLWDETKAKQADLVKMFGSTEEEIKQVGAAYALTGHTGEETQVALHKLWDAKTPEQFNAAMQPIAETLKTLQQNTEDLQATTTDATGRISESWKRVIDLNAKYGANTLQVRDFIKQQSGVAVDGLNAIVAAQQDAVTGYDAIKKAVDDANAALEANPHDAKAASALADALTRQSAAGKVAAPELGDLGTAATGSYAASVASGMSKIDAVKAESSALTTLEQEYKDLGLTVEDVGLKSLFTQNDMQKGASALYAGVDGLTKRMVALDNINLETKESFAADQRTAEQMYTRLQAAAAAAGGATADALLPMQDYLHQAEIEAKKLGVPLDALTQQMIDQSKDSGVWKDAVTPSPTMQDEMQAFVDKVDDLVQALRGLPPNIHTKVTVDTSTTTSSGPPENQPTTGDNTAARGGYVGATRIMHLKAGGPVGTDTVNAWLTPGESVLTRSATKAIGYDTIASWNAGATSGFLKGDEQWKGPWTPMPMDDNGGFAVPAWTPPTVWTDMPSAPPRADASASPGRASGDHVQVSVSIQGWDGMDIMRVVRSDAFTNAIGDAIYQNKGSMKTRIRAALGGKS